MTIQLCPLILSRSAWTNLVELVIAVEGDVEVAGGGVDASVAQADHQSEHRTQSENLFNIVHLDFCHIACADRGGGGGFGGTASP